MEFLYEYGLFLLKAVTLVLVIIIILSAVISASQKHKQPQGDLDIQNLSEGLEDMCEHAQSLLLDKDELKKREKEKKKRPSKKQKTKNLKPKRKRKSKKMPINPQNKSLKLRVRPNRRKPKPLKVNAYLYAILMVQWMLARWNFYVKKSPRSLPLTIRVTKYLYA